MRVQHSIAFLLLTALLLGACASPETRQPVDGDSTHAAAVDSSRITGTITYRERIALPPDAVVNVELVEVSGTGAERDVVVEKSITEPGQVPIPFTLAYAPGLIDSGRHYVIEVTIVDDEDRVLWATPEGIPVLTHGASETLEVLVHRLGPAQTVWEAARQRGVAFRAVGNEPGWLLEVYDTPAHFDLSVDYGQTTHTFTDVEREAGPGTGQTTYRARTGDHTLEAVLDDKTCQDTMSGEIFETTVTVRLDDRTLQGCGRSLR